MMDILQGVYSLAQISHVTIDSLIFRLHSNATVILLISFSIVVSTREYVGNPIDCANNKDIPEETLNMYCWIHSTYTVPKALRMVPGRQVPHPGMANSDLGQTKHMKYYQWVAFMLFFQFAKMLDIFRGLKNLIKISHIHIDSPVFRLHYSITVMILISFSLIVTTRQYVGNPIDCIHTKDIPEDVLNTYCWIHSTYVVPRAFMKKQNIPGVDTVKDEKDKKLIRYYQWVCFCLFFQAILFYTPRWLWKSWEGGKIHALMMDLDIGICSEVEKKQKKKLMIDYLWENLRFHNWWAYKYYFCEMLALVNVIGQMFLMDRFFDGEFLTFGIEVIKFLDNDEEDRIDPMIKIFPRMTKCTFHKYGVSGEVEKHDAICILPLNVVNEKIYVFLWFWFIILSCLTLVTVVYRVIIIFSPRMRVYLLRMRYRLIRREAIDLIVRRSKMGDWFLFYMLGENVDSVIFRDVMQELAYKLGSNPGHHMPGPKGEILEA